MNLIKYYKKIFFMLFFAAYISQNFIYSQTFTKITEGDIVNEQLNSGGSSWVDVDGDGDQDLFVANGNLNLQKNSLFINNGDGTFTTYAQGEIVNETGKSIGGVWGDLENDGYPDLFVTNRESATNFLYKNNGDLTFTKVTTSAAINDPANSNNSFWVDIENDGDLDIYVLNFAETNFLYLNDGGGNFAKFNNSPIITDNDQSIVASWGDYDNDGDLDLFKGIGGNTSNILYENIGALNFFNTNNGVIAAEKFSTLGASWADIDNDGDLDLFVANFLGQNNSLFINNGNGSFTQITTGSIVADGGNSVGTSFGDIDNDGDLDLFVGNYTQNNFLYLNDGAPNYTFTKVTNSSIVSDAGNTFGVSMCDYDNDGDLDIYASNQDNQKNFLYRNNGNNNNWINIKLTGKISNKSAVGTVIKLKCNINGQPVWQMRHVESQSGYNSQNSLNSEFGLAESTIIDSILIKWASGIEQVITGVGPNQFIAIEENGSTDIKDKSALPDEFKLNQNYPNPFNPSTKISFTIQNSASHAEAVYLKIYDLLGNEVATLLNGEKITGKHEVEFNASNLSSGMYFYNLTSGTFSKTKKMILLK